MRPVSAWVALVSAVLVSSCSYSPSFDNGVLVCSSTNTCPKGYSCASDGACWKAGTGPSDGDPYARFVGTWTFESGSLNASCSDGVPSTMPLTGQSIPIVASGTGISAFYYCNWILHRPAGSNAAVADPNQSCTQTDPDSAPGVKYMYTWSGIEFSFTTTDGQRAMLTGHVSGPFSASDGSRGTCDGKFSGMLTIPPP